jgi:biotin-dependent carboxylase-like uncharacterized protein
VTPRSVTVEDPGPLTTVQDSGRPGHAHLGVPRSGWLDDAAARLANRLVGNDGAAALLENVLGGLVLRCEHAVALAVTGAPVEVRVDGRAVDTAGAVSVRAGAVVRLGRPTAGLRCYVALAGGVDVPPELGSRSTDTLSGLGPPPVRQGERLPLGSSFGDPGAGEQARGRLDLPVVLRCLPGPRADWCPPGLADRLAEARYVAGPESDRVGLRLQGPALERREGELLSEGMVLGAVQLPPDGQLVVFLNDHPTTGGYPVVAVVAAEDVARCAQVRPGDEVRLSPRRSAGWP